MNLYIAHTNLPVINKKELFIVTRPFFKEGKWVDTIDEKWDFNFILSHDIDDTNFVLLPFSINYYFASKKSALLEELNLICQQHDIKAYGLISGDFGIAYPEFSNIIYFRMGGFKSQLSSNNQGFPFALSDQFQQIFKQEEITPLSKCDLPVVGFCGHATLSFSKRMKEIAKCLIENGKRFFKNPLRKDWETLFASAYERAKLLQYLENSPLIKTNIICRNNYRAGAQTQLQREQTTLEYYNNLAYSDYVLCVRGAGNFSVRFYETLMMGKIPIFVNTDCLLPFVNKINWKKHVVWIEWKDRKNIATLVRDFHNQLSNDDFIEIQSNNRKLWKETLSVKGILNMISSESIPQNSNKTTKK